MQIQNPYKPGSLYHQNFQSHVAWYKDKTADELKAKFDDLMLESQDFMRHGWQSMSNFKIQADDIATIYLARFGKPIIETTGQEAAQ